MLLVLPVTESLRIAPRAFEAFYQQKYENALQKALCFVRKEGIVSTYRKYRSKLVERHIESEQAVVMARVELNGTVHCALTRSLGEPLIFHERLVFQAPESLALRDVRLSRESQLLLESYLPVPSCPVPDGLAELILRDNPGLRPSSVGVLSPFRMSVRPASAAACAGGEGEVYLLGFGSYIREYVLPQFGPQVQAAVDHKAQLIRGHVRLAFPLHERLERVLPRIAGAKRPLVIIATYHSDHVPMCRAVLDANPEARVFIEKPAGVGMAQINQLVAARDQGAWIEIGFNRRYAELTRQMVAEVGACPRPYVIMQQVKELKIPPTHWYFWSNQGTRITGNLCHWIDLAQHIVQCPATQLVLLNSGDTVAVSLSYADGSLANITATDRGSDLRGVEEAVDVRAGCTSIHLRDFQELTIRSGARARHRQLFHQERGHAKMYAELKRRWKCGLPPLYSLDDLYWVGLVTDAASEMLRSGQRWCSFEVAGRPSPVGASLG